jgi:hypothetical protein
VFLAGLGVLAGGIAWAASYQPVTTGNTGMDPIPSREGAAAETVATFRSGKPFRFGASITNTGQFAVDIVGVPAFTNGAFRVRPYMMRVGVHGLILPAVPFHAFTLKAGQEWMILLRGSYAKCCRSVAGNSTTIVGLFVRGRFMLWTRTVEVPLLSPIVVQNLGERCR